MPDTRLSALDASFLEVESPTAHMHVGWMASFVPSAGRPAPTYHQIHKHLESRLCRAPRYRQRLAEVPFSLHEPLWVDDEDFDCARHLHHARTSNLDSLADAVLSVPLQRDRPLWEMWIAPDLPGRRIGLVGKAHHCLVDGIAAVEMASLLLDPTAEPPPPEPDGWSPRPAPTTAKRLAGAARDRLREQAGLLTAPLRLASSPRRIVRTAGQGRRMTGALASAMAPATPDRVLNPAISPDRHLARLQCSFEDLRRIRAHFQTTINDVLLAVCAGGVRRLLEDRGERPRRLKTMVPVSLRDAGAESELGNRISFIFVELPCDQSDPVERLYDVHRSTSERKRAGRPEGADTVLKAIAHAPRPLQQVASHMVASERAFNLTISNIPGPPQPQYMLGCRLEEAYPVVPLADRHALAIGMHTSGGHAFLGLHADRRALPDADRLADDIGSEIEALVSLT